MNVKPGIREYVYLNGNTLSTFANAIRLRTPKAEVNERLADTTLVTERPLPWDGAPDVIVKYGFSLEWERIAAADIETFEDMVAYGWPVDLCIWRPVTERFSGTGTRTDFTISRRLALDELATVPPIPVGGTTTYATEVLVGGVAKTLTTDYTVGVASSIGHVTFSFVSAPAAGDGNVVIRYVPLFLVTNVSAEPGYQLPHRESRTIEFEEVG